MERDDLKCLSLSLFEHATTSNSLRIKKRLSSTFGYSIFKELKEWLTILKLPIEADK